MQNSLDQAEQDPFGKPARREIGEVRVEERVRRKDWTSIIIATGLGIGLGLLHEFLQRYK